MNNTNLIFIKLHRDYQNTTPIEYFIDINKIISIEPNVNKGGTIINTVSNNVFYCKESVSEVMNLMDEAFKSRILNTDYKRYLK